MEKQERELIEQRLTEALEKLSLIESGLADPSSIEDKGLVAELQKLLKEKDGTIQNLEDRLTTAVEAITNKEAELELAKAMSASTDSLGVKPDQVVVNALQKEIDLLKSALEDLRLESENGTVGDADMKNLQKQLRKRLLKVWKHRWNFRKPSLNLLSWNKTLH